MYLKKLVIENAGPIASLTLELPFEDENPLPVVIVGANGSGKSTLLSFVVNALIGFKQQAFEKAEVEHNRVYRVRSGRYIQSGTHWYHAKAEFDGGLSLEEWVLDRPRGIFATEVSPLPSDEGWKLIEETESDRFLLLPTPNHPITNTLSKQMQKLFQENVVLFFPSDRFEFPEWLNETSVTSEITFPEPVKFTGQTARRIFARSLLKPTLQWIKALALDFRIADYVMKPVMLTENGITSNIEALVSVKGRDSKIIDVVFKFLECILDAEPGTIQLQFSNRNTGTIAVGFLRNGCRELIPSLLGLSAGQAALFCIFVNIIKDFDLSGSPFVDINDIRGIVLLDEADLHLHVDLQYRVLPILMQLFPRVQFIVTAHSPLFVMGMEKAFGNCFRCIEMPSGDVIETEAFSEFDHALEAFTRTRAFDKRVVDRISAESNPVIIVEGKFDVQHLEIAWQKLHPNNPMPWVVISSDGYSSLKGGGGAKMLRTLLHACCLHVQRPVLGLFDHDREGVEQVESLIKDGFQSVDGRAHLKHSTKPVQSLLLPVPPNRANFIAQNAKSCFLAIEHFYSDILLDHYDLKDDPVAVDSQVFTITSESKKKLKFAEVLPTLDMAEFANFEILFERLAQAFEITLLPDVTRTPSSSESPQMLVTQTATTILTPTETL